MILASQSEAFKEENVPAKRLHELDQQMEKKDESLYFMDRMWVSLVGGTRTIIMNEAHKTRYYVHPRADKMYHDLRDMYWWLGIKKDIATYASKCLTYSKYLKGAIREWIATKRLDSSKLKNEHLSRLSLIDVKIDHDNTTDLDFLNRRKSSRILGN
uniref:Putative reverse transcriptase domain-containing protein n=1 Tax=Tanacetum cinerariifolium TaxID=118510 RepID=A0A6L2KWT5_TANCI|nr:putative reverse transcriptase domain-containing protein [Tanacetum cinerariifolium]